MATPATTHGAFSWTELTTSDPKDARRFYGKLLGWQFQDMDMGSGTYTVINVAGQGVGGITAVPPNAQGMAARVGRLRHRRRRRCRRLQGRGTRRSRAACADGHPDRRPVRHDHGSAGSDVVAHHLCEKELAR